MTFFFLEQLSGNKKTNKGTLKQRRVDVELKRWLNLSFFFWQPFPTPKLSNNKAQRDPEKVPQLHTKYYSHIVILETTRLIIHKLFNQLGFLNCNCIFDERLIKILYFWPPQKIYKIKLFFSFMPLISKHNLHICIYFHLFQNEKVGVSFYSYATKKIKH